MIAKKYKSLFFLLIMLTIGIDDAGRGPIIGPMILAGVLVDENAETFLKKYKVRDSKQYLHNSHRVQISSLIKKAALSYKVVKASPQEIDEAIETKININTLEAMKAAEIINYLNDKNKKIKVIVDCPSNNTKKWHYVLLKYIEHPENLEVSCEHKADVNHVSVGAASILAKVTREEEVEKIKDQYGKIGSGYPADPTTKEFLKSHGSKLKDSGIFRKSWATWKKLYPEKKQSTLEGF